MHSRDQKQSVNRFTPLDFGVGLHEYTKNNYIYSINLYSFIHKSHTLTQKYHNKIKEKDPIKEVLNTWLRNSI